MKNENQVQNVIEYLIRYYRTKKEAAKSLKISYSHFRNISNGFYHVTPRMQQYLYDAAKNIGYKD